MPPTLRSLVRRTEAYQTLASHEAVTQKAAAASGPPGQRAGRTVLRVALASVPDRR